MRHEIVNLPPGWRGTDATVAAIRRIVDQSLLDPVVVSTAQNLVRNLPERDKDAEISAVSNFVRGKIRYTNEGIETLKTPRVMLDEIKQYGRAVGDCDDHVILWSALHRALGNKVRYKVISQRQDQIANHIYAEVFSPARGWVVDELIVKSQPLGWVIPGHKVTKSVTYLGGDDMIGQVDPFLTGDEMRRKRMESREARRRQRREAQDVRRAARGLRPRPRRFNPWQGLSEDEAMDTFAEATNLGDVGFIPAVLAAVAAVAPALSKLKKKKKSSSPAPTPAPTPTPPAPYGGAGGNTMMYVGLGFAGLLLLMFAMKK